MQKPAPVSRHVLAGRLARCSREGLAAVMVAAEQEVPDEADANALADRLVRELWWRTHSPASLVAMPGSLDRLVDRVAEKLGHDLPDGDAWLRLDALVSAVLPDGRVEDLDDLGADTLARLSRQLGGAVAGVAGGAGAAGSRLAAIKLLQWTRGPVWDLVPLLPKVGPVFTGVRAGATTLARVSAPVGVALALLSLNQTLGAEDDRALPLLLGAGLLLREGPAPVQHPEPVDLVVVPEGAHGQRDHPVVDATEVDPPDGDDPAG